MKIFPPVLALSAIFALSGCASLLQGTHEKLTIRTSPAGALCNVYRQDEGLMKVIVTPGAAYVRRDSAPVTIVCKKDGFQESKIELTPNRDILGGAGGTAQPFANIGFPLDAANSAFFDLPDEAQLVLRKK